jgi:hypothetical protein
LTAAEHNAAIGTSSSVSPPDNTSPPVVTGQFDQGSANRQPKQSGHHGAGRHSVTNEDHAGTDVAQEIAL